MVFLKYERYFSLEYLLKPGDHLPGERDVILGWSLIPGQKLLKIQCQTDFPQSYGCIQTLFAKPIWLGRKSVSNTANFQILMRLSSIWANFHQLPSWRNTQNQCSCIIVRNARIQWFRVFSSVRISWNNLVTWKYLT